MHEQKQAFACHRAGLELLLQDYRATVANIYADENLTPTACHRPVNELTSEYAAKADAEWHKVTDGGHHPGGSALCVEAREAERLQETFLGELARAMKRRAPRTPVQNLQRAPQVLRSWQQGGKVAQLQLATAPPSRA